MPPVKKISDCNDLVPAKKFPKDIAKFPFESFNPVQSRIFDIYDKDANCIIAAATSAGKAQPDDTLILTPFGFYPLKNIVCGDFVIGRNGRPVRVVGVYPQGRLQTYKVLFDDNTYTRCCEDHLWDVRTKSDKYRKKSYRTLPLRDVVSNFSKNKWHIPIVSPIHFTNLVDLKIHPYVLGMLLGDGGLGYGAKLSCGDNFCIEKVSKLLPDGVGIFHDGGVDYRIVSIGGDQYNAITWELRQMGLLGKMSHEKFIPHVYKYSSLKDRIDLLNGLMDSDGGVTSNKSPTFEVTSKQLALDMAEIVRSLGGWTCLRKKEKSTYKYRGEIRNGRNVFRLTISIPEICPFTLPRKIINCHEKKRTILHNIYDIKKDVVCECRCIKVESEDGLYVTNDYIITHNTVCAEMFMSHEVRKRGGKAMYLAPLKALAKEKTDDWTDESHHFGDLNLSICTGDYRLTSDRKKELENSNIILMTSEMLNARSRNYKAEHNEFMKNIGTLVIDECFTEDSLVTTERGLLRIGDIIDKKLDVKVLSFNHATGQTEFKRILKYQKKNQKKKWYSIYYNGGNITVTENQMIWVEGRGYVAAKNIKKGDILYAKWLEKQKKQKPRRFNRIGKKCYIGNIIGRRFDKIERDWEISKIKSKSIIGTNSVCRVEVYFVKEAGWNPAANIAKRRMGEGGSEVCNPFLSRIKRDLRYCCCKQCEDYNFKLVVSNFTSNCTGCMVYGRWKSEQESDGYSHRRFYGGRGEDIVVLADGKVESRVFPISNKKILVSSFFSHRKRCISRFDKGVSDTRDEIQITSENGGNLLFNVWDKIYSKSQTDKKFSASSDLWSSELLSKVEEYEGEGEEISVCCDLEIEDNNNFFVNGVLCHNSHLLTVPRRGDHLEVGLMKFTQISPNARLILLSATMPNVDEISDWVSYYLTGKETYLLESKYRPCPLGIHYVDYIERSNYEDNELAKVDEAIQLVRKYKDDKFLVFVHTKRTGNMMKDFFKRMGIDCEFHNADLEKKERHSLEKKFKEDPSFRVIIATSTLAWGLNLPARRVVITGLHRGLELVENYDIWQMAGRAGRPGYDPRGDVYILLPESEKDMHIKRIQSPQRIESKLLDNSGTVDPETGKQSSRYKTFAFHLVSEIHHRDVKNKKDIHEWYSKSLARFQSDKLDNDVIDSTLEMLIKRGCIKEEDEEYVATVVGAISSMFYYPPLDVADLRRNFKNIFENGYEKNDLLVSFMLGNVDSQRGGIVNRDEREEMSVYRNKLMSKCDDRYITEGVIKAGYSYFCLMNGYNLGAVTGLARGLQFDFPRCSAVLTAIDNMNTKWKKTDWIRRLQARMIYGVGSELVDLVQLPAIGKVRAEKLWAAGLKTVEAIAGNPDKVKRALNMKDEAIANICSHAKSLALVS